MAIDFLAAVSGLCGWIYTICWSLSFYPQVLLNARRRSTAGTTVDFPFINSLGFFAYLVSNVALRYSPVVRAEYARRHHGLTPTVAFNDVVWAAHSFVLSVITTSQYLMPGLWGWPTAQSEGGNGGTAPLTPGESPTPRASAASTRPSKPILGLATGSVVAIAVAVALVLFVPEDAGGWTWLDVVYALGYVKLVITLVKYSPQVLANYRNRSTRGWSIWQILLDFAGGVLSIAQLLLDSYRQRDWSGLTGNPVKLLLGNVSMAYDVVFFAQHYVLYRHANGGAGGRKDYEEEEGEGDSGNGAGAGNGRRRSERDALLGNGDRRLD